MPSPYCLLGRRAPAAQTAKGRLPVGTPNVTTHSHIQIIPRDKRDYTVVDEYYEDDVPTFRSPSLQFPLSSHQQSRQVLTATEESAQGKTFADMARRYTRKELEGEERPTSGPVSLAGLIKFQPNRKKSNKSWRPIQLSDFGDDDDGGGSNENTDLGDDDLSTLPDNFSGECPLDSSCPTSSYLRASHYDLPSLKTNISMNSSLRSQGPPAQGARLNSGESFSRLRGESNSDTGPINTRFGVVEDYTRLFGKQLPDPIRLHEEMGDFDGQIIFIGHPNRDVSAHQWSSPSFQWVHIGLYSHTRRKIEGSLASDRLRRGEIPNNTIEYFKALAEQREINIKEHGRPEEQKPQDSPKDHHVEGPHQPIFIGSECIKTFSSAPDSTGEKALILPRKTPSGNQATSSAFRMITRDYLEDPFITPSKVSRPAIPTIINFGSTGADTVGSMNFDYEFPTKPTTYCGAGPSEQSSEMTSQQLIIQHERERLDMIRRSINPQEHETQPNLREVGFGEEAMSGFTTPVDRHSLNRRPISMSPEDIHNRQILKNRLSELGESTRRSSLPVEARIAVPDVQGLQGSARALFPPPGLTVANPHRIISTLNANAAPYKRASTCTRSLEDTASEVTTVNIPQIVNLQYSDPDGIVPAHVHEIANGLGHQAPTVQKFKGPFFAETMPTTNDLTTSLSFQVNDKEKLVNWFRDGQRPARQQEYAMTLMATADTHSKSRRMKDFGAIGDGCLKKRNHETFENTPGFVRLYENLYEYLEESRAEGRCNFFTRAWKPAQPHHRELNHDSNNSFFGDSYNGSSQMQRISHIGFQSFIGPTWGGYGFSSTVTIPTRFSHGMVLDGCSAIPNSSGY